MLTPFHWPEMFSLAECSAIIRLAEAKGLREAGLVRGRQNESIRRAQIAWLDDAGDAAWVFQRLTGTVLAANRQHFQFELTEFAERIQVALYQSDQAGHFDWHVDIGAGPFASKRKLTVVAQLSDASSYTGGSLELNATGQVLTSGRTQGDAILFPSFIPHRVAEISQGTRFSLTTWVHGPAFR